MKRRSKWFILIPLVGLVVFALVAGSRLQMASAEVRRDSNALETMMPLDIGETSTLEIQILYEGAAALSGLHTGLGVSYLIKTDTATILFDVGNNPSATSPSPLEQNMAHLGVSLDQVDMIVLSHTHFDHTGGQRWRSQGTFAVGGDTQALLGSRPIYLPEALSYPGSTPAVITSPTKIAEGVATTGAIPFVYPFPAWLAIPQGVEQSLVVNLREQGLVLITGCGHMGLESLLAHSQAEFSAPVVGVIGGLHEGQADAQALVPQIELLQSIHPVVVGLSPHDSGLAALEAFQKAFPVAYQPVAVGAVIKVQ